MAFMKGKVSNFIAMLVIGTVLLLSLSVIVSAKEKEGSPVARVNSTEYTNLDSAVAAFNSSGGTFTLLADCQKNLDVGEHWITLKCGGTFDLNGHMLQATGGSSVICIETTNTKVTLTDNSANRNGRISGSTSYSIWHDSSGDVVVDGGTYQNFLRYGKGTLIINDGIFENYSFGNVDDAEAKVIFNGGLFKYGIWFTTGKNQNIYELLGNGKTYMVDGGIMSRTSVQALGNVYEIGTGKEVEVVNEAAPVYTAPVAKTGLVYSGEEMQLVNEGSVTGGTMQYARGTATEPTSPFSTLIPVEKNVGTFYVWYKIIGDDTHHDIAPKCIEVSIKKGTLKAEDFSFDAPSHNIYNGRAKHVDVIVKPYIVGAGNITVKYYDVNDALLNEAPVNVGRYIVRIDVDEGANYNAITDVTDIAWTFVINKAEQAAPTGLGHTDETISQKADGMITGVTSNMEYRKDGETTYTGVNSSKLENLAAGKYFVRYAADSNHNASSDVAVTIGAGEKLVVTLPQNQVDDTGSATATVPSATPSAPQYTQTGDNSNPWLWLLLIIGSCLVGNAVFEMKRHKIK